MARATNGASVINPAPTSDLSTCLGAGPPASGFLVRCPFQGRQQGNADAPSAGRASLQWRVMGGRRRRVTGATRPQPWAGGRALETFHTLVWRFAVRPSGGASLELTTKRSSSPLCWTPSSCFRRLGPDGCDIHVGFRSYCS